MPAWVIWMIAAGALVGFIAIGVGPAFLREGARLLLAPWRSAETAQPYAIAVMPGNVTVANPTQIRFNWQIGEPGCDHPAPRRGRKRD